MQFPLCTKFQYVYIMIVIDEEYKYHKSLVVSDKRVIPIITM